MSTRAYSELWFAAIEGSSLTTLRLHLESAQLASDAAACARMERLIALTAAGNAPTWPETRP